MTTEENPKPPIFLDILNSLEKVIQGKTNVLQKILVAFFAGGHILLEDVPGVGKTTLAKSLAASLQASYQRIQFTPDLLPTDITGSTIYQPKTGEFTFRPGPIFCNILLADEINRSSPRTQSALLEAMSERQITIEGKAMPLDNMFIVIATQNPVEFHGTYPLPEAQLDRFLMRLELGYPQREHELFMLFQQRKGHPLNTLSSVVGYEEIQKAKENIQEVEVKERVASYLLSVVEASRQDIRVRLGVSPRGSLALFRTTQVWAWSQGRKYAIPDDVKSVATAVLSHRLVLETKARHSGITKEEIIKEILHQIKVPT